MARRKKKRIRRKKIKINEWILPLALILGLATFVAAAAFYQPPQKKAISKLPAAEYFEIIEPTTSNARFVDNRSGLIIYDLGFKLKAVRGPAHEITILSWANSPTVDVGDLQQGEVSSYVSMQSSSGYYTTKEEGGFPVTIEVTCLEAKGEVTFYLTD